jgi:ribonuclease P protein component
MAGSLEMITSAADFAALQAGGRSRAHPLLVVRFRANELGRTRYGISTARRVGNAVTRNRIRRRLRELLRSYGAQVGAGWDILLVARPGAGAVSQAELGSALERLLSNAGLLSEAAAGE